MGWEVGSSLFLVSLYTGPFLFAVFSVCLAF